MNLFAKTSFWSIRRQEIKSLSGTSGRTRTATPVKEPDFESGVSTNFTTLALFYAIDGFRHEQNGVYAAHSH